MIAKLDRLSRNAQFLLNLVEGTSDAGVMFCRPADYADRADGHVLHPSSRSPSRRGRADLAPDQGGAGGGEGARCEDRRLREAGVLRKDGRSRRARRSRAAASEAARRAQGRVARQRAAELAPMIDGAARERGITSLGELARALDESAAS